MLTHRRASPVAPDRVVIVGAGGFVGKAAANRLLSHGVRVVGMARQDVDLLAQNATERLTAILRKDDTLVMIAAQAPVKNNVMLVDNLRMMGAVCATLAYVPVEHVIYVSSDAVYADADGPLRETSCAQPTSLHGVMHLARETMLANSYTGPLCILRPTLIYGAADPHNGYGPNRFRRLAAQGEPIKLFGGGEEMRDHVLIDDLGRLIELCILHRSAGVLNVATGTSHSFRSVAEKVASLFDDPVEVQGTPRQSPITHVHFDNLAAGKAFPDFRFMELDAGLRQTHEAARRTDG